MFGFLAAFLMALVAATGGPVQGSSENATTTPDAPIPPRTAKTLIVLAGDSTVTEEKGWGPGFEAHLVGDIQCINLSKSGRSSKSYLDEGYWKKCLELKPQYILIQFGHNDEKVKDPTRGTYPDTTYSQNLSMFVDQARAIGAAPILVTSISRRQWGPDGKIHSTLVPYVNAMKKVAAAKNVPLIDLHALSIAYYEAHGKAAINKLSRMMVPENKPDYTAKGSGKPTTAPATRPGELIVDNTHFNALGSKVFGTMMAEQLVKVAPQLKPYFH